MVARVHYATLAKAQKLGFVVTGDVTDTVYTVKWPERNRVVIGTGAKQAVEDMRLVKMLALEYPALKPIQVGDDCSWTLHFDGAPVAGGETLEAAWDAFCAEQEGDDWASDYQDETETEEEETETEEEDNGRSVVKKSYKRAYKPFKAKCGDELSKLISAHVQCKDEDGRVRTDEAKLEAFAKANDCWVDDYQFLNVGMRRMNIANRARGRVKKGTEIVWA